MSNRHSKRVYLVLESWEIGGTETYVERLVEYLHRIGYDVEVILLKQNTLSENNWNFQIHIVSLFSLRRFLRVNNTGLCHLHLYTNLLPATIIIKTLGIPILTTLHIPLRNWGVRHRIYTRLAASFADSLVGVSKEACAGLAIGNIYPYAIPGPIGREFSKIQRENADREMFTVIAVGRLSKEKNIDVLISAMKKCSSKLGKKVRLIHFGGGPLDRELSTFAQELGVMVEWKGFQPRVEIAHALAQSDVFVLPSQFEGFGLSATEAMSVGIAAILSDFPAAKELITDGVTGHTFPIGDSDALADLLVWHSLNPEQSAAIGKAGREFVLSQFSEERCFGHYLSIYDELLNIKL